MYLLGLCLVAMETFADQRSRSASPSMVYTTLKRALKPICSVGLVATILINGPIDKQLACISFSEAA